MVNPQKLSIETVLHKILFSGMRLVKDCDALIMADSSNKK
jgi:hypothetical protein